MPVSVHLNQRKRTYLDPIHRDVVLDRFDATDQLLIDLIDTPEFQRLRRIHQLGVSFFTFQGAEGSRFTHCVGVMHIASQLVESLADRTPEIRENRALILTAALLHDLGHGPYSHVTEKILGYDHEDWSCRIIAGDTGVNQVLKEFDRGLPEAIVAVLKKRHKPKYITDLISSQLDCDRFDYLLRDSYLTGTAYGMFGLQRILSSLRVDTDHDRIVVSGEKGQAAVEDYLFARYSMYQQVYYHRKNLAARALLSRIIQRARESGDELLFMDEPTRGWLSGKQSTMSVADYLFLDDVQMTYHIKRWTQERDKILADLAQRFLHRRLFNASKLPRLTTNMVEALKEETRGIVAAAGFDPDYYVAIESTGLRPYDYYRPGHDHPQTNIMVRTERGEVRELSTLSPTVEALVRGSFDTYWLIYPSEVRDAVQKLLEASPSPG